MPSELPQNVRRQIEKLGLPTEGQHPFVPELKYSRQGKVHLKSRVISHGQKAEKQGYVDCDGRIWIKDHAHAGLPDHWDVQIDDGKEYFRVDMNGNELV